MNSLPYNSIPVIYSRIKEQAKSFASGCSSLADLKFGHFSYGKDISRRVAQIFIQRNFSYLVNTNSENQSVGAERKSTSSSDKIFYRPGLGRYILTNKEVCRQCIRFVVLWTLMFRRILSSLATQGNSSSVSILDSDIEPLIGSEDISDFVDLELIKSIGIAGPLIAKSPRSQFRSKEVICNRDPIACILKETSFSRLRKLRLIAMHLMALCSYFKIVFLDKRCSLLAADFSKIAVYQCLDRLKLINFVVKTNADFDDQPMWFADISKNLRSVFVWYSTNCLPIHFKKELSSTALIANFPQYSFLAFDESYVWNSCQKNWLEKLGYEGNTLHIGGMPFKFQTNQNHCAKTMKPSLVIFDVTPAKESFLRSRIIGPDAYNFYSYANSKQLLLDIFEVTKKISEDIRIAMKPKRSYSEIHDTRYRQFIRSQTWLNIEAHDSNILELIGKSSLVICTPFTSPYFLAKKLGVPTVFYDPTGIIELLDEQSSFQLVQSKPELLEWITESLKRTLG